MPVWPICFCSIWPMPADAFIRLPAASTPMSLMPTPASRSAPCAASKARSTVSLSGCFPNFVMVIPSIQASLAISRVLLSRLGGLVAEADGRGAFGVSADRERHQPYLHAQCHMLGVGRRVHDTGRHARATAVDNPGDERDGHTLSCEVHDRKRL